MYHNYNPESSQFLIHSTSDFSSKDSTQHHQPKQTTFVNKKHTMNSQSTSRSVAKFKRTNPNIQQFKQDDKITTSQQLEHQQNNYTTNNQETYRSFETMPQLNLINSLNTSRESPTKRDSKKYYISPQSKVYGTDRMLSKGKYQHRNEELISLRSFRSGKSKESKADNENYSLYWKKKAHEYLQRNFKLAEELNELKRQISNNESKCSKEDQLAGKLTQLQSQKGQQRTVALHVVEIQQRQYIQQINKLQSDNRLKDLVIQSLENKIIELSQEVKGEREKSELLEKLRCQVSDLQEKNQRLEREYYKVTKVNTVYEMEMKERQVRQQHKGAADGEGVEHSNDIDSRVYSCKNFVLK